MSLECSECEHDLRGGHDLNCSRAPVMLNVSMLTDNEVWDLGREFYGRNAAKELRTAMVKKAAEQKEDEDAAESV